LLKININKFLIILVACASLINKSYSQDLVDDVGSSFELGDSSEMFVESIRIISRSKRIFILTNTNQMLNKGDFITIVLNDKDAVARALVGKDHQGLAGIKILKIYSLKNWASMKQNLDVKILKGDDRSLFTKTIDKKIVEDDKDNEGIDSEKDLYDTSMIDQDLNMFGKDNRLIKPDNVVSAGFSRYTLENDLTEDTEIYNELSGSWAFQFSDNIWLEGLYGRILMSGVPAEGSQTLINDLTLRIKYTFNAPLYSYVLPYIGFQMYSVDSPDAGSITNDALAEKELEFIDKLKKNDFIFGITILKRLVPGWFLKADLGTDQMNLGFAIEF
jgi:hypothetical protein